MAGRAAEKLAVEWTPGTELPRQQTFYDHLRRQPSNDAVVVDSGKIQDVMIGEQTIAGSVAVDSLEGILPAERVEALRRNAGKNAEGKHAFATVRVEDPQLVEALQAAGVRFAGRTENTFLRTLLSWVLPALIFIGLWSLLLRRMSPHAGMFVGQSAKCRNARQLAKLAHRIHGV